MYIVYHRGDKSKTNRAPSVNEEGVAALSSLCAEHAQWPGTPHPLQDLSATYIPCTIQPRATRLAALPVQPQVSRFFTSHIDTGVHTQPTSVQKTG